jgi:iron complex transport system ATP-binding protein
MTTALEVRGVSVIRGTSHLLREVSMAIACGEVVALVGPNGAGKSTLLNVLAGDIVPDRGNVLMNGRPLSSIDARTRARSRGVLPQQTFLQFGFRAREVVAMGRTPLPPVSEADDAAAIARALRETETEHLGERVFPMLSGGEQTRVSLSRIVAQETPIVLLDEPTAALDIRHQHMVMQTARSLAQQGGTVIAILHDLNLALSYADRVGILESGRLVACDTPWKVALPELLTSVFAYPLTVTAHPDGRHPMVLPRSAASRLHPRTSR